VSFFRRMRGALRRRYGRAITGPQTISYPVGGDRFDVIVVDNKGTRLKTIARRVPYGLAKVIIRKHHP
jgi:hypothetical protein